MFIYNNYITLLIDYDIKLYYLFKYTKYFIK